MSLDPGFDCSEACDLLTLCAIIEDGSIKGPPPTPPPVPPPPTGWGPKPIYDPGEIGPFDNKWQLWKNSNTGSYAIVIRGTTMEPESIAEDLLFPMIKGKDGITVNIPTLSPFQIGWEFANSPKAGVHLGFAIGALILFYHYKGILLKLSELKIEGKLNPGDNIFIAGHSQGAAVGTLIRSLLHYSDLFNDSDHFIKSYLFAQPKPGNDHYATEFEHLFCIPRMAFRITNSLDWVPQAPLTLEWFQDINTPNPLSTGKLSSSALKSNPLFSAIDDAINKISFPLEEKAQNLIRSAIPTLIQRTPEIKEIPKELLDQMKFEFPLVFSLNYLNAATEIPLLGNPCSGKEECDDSFFEHHTYTYYSLLQSQYPGCKP